MQFTVLFVLLACLALSVVSASKESGHHPLRKNVGQAVETPTKRVKRHAAWHQPRPVLYNDYYRRPYYIYL